VLESKQSYFKIITPINPVISSPNERIIPSNGDINEVKAVIIPTINKSVMHKSQGPVIIPVIKK
jgi:hypothetical protein